MNDKTQQLGALEDIQAIVNDLPEQEREQVLMYAEEIRDILSEGGNNGFLALTLVACEFSAVNEASDSLEAGQDDQPAEQ